MLAYAGCLLIEQFSDLSPCLEQMASAHVRDLSQDYS
jgi:hypothetical protein